MLLVIVDIIIITTSFVVVDKPSTPVNFTLAAIRPTSADLVWMTGSHVEPDTFEITVRSSADLVEERVRIEIPGVRRQYTLHDLRPLVQYRVFITATNNEGTSVASDLVVFHTMLG